MTELRRRFPGISDPERLVRDGRVLVNGFPVTNPRSLVARDASIAIVEPQPLRGTLKLRAALEAFGVAVAGRVALDVGAAAGGFTVALLDAGAARVYAVDAGHGQLLGSLRQDPRVVNLERTNLAAAGRVVPEVVELVVVDVSYVSLAAALPQLDVELASDAELVALVKPQFELGLAEPPDDPKAALAPATGAASDAAWRVVATIESPLGGSRGAVEFFVHARR